MAKTAGIMIERPKIGNMLIGIIGRTELILPRFTEKAKTDLMNSMAGKKILKRSNRDYDEDYLQSHYESADGQVCMNVLAFKCAMVDACRAFDTVKMTVIRQAVFVQAEEMSEDGTPLIPIYGKPYMRIDRVTQGIGGIDLRVRTGVRRWKALLHMEWNMDMINQESLLSLLFAAGDVGVGQWRPGSPKGKSGWAGRFTIAQTMEEWERFEV